MLRSYLLSMVLGLAVATSSFAATGPVEHPGSVPVLLGLEVVRTDLKLESLQRAVLDSLRSEYRDAVRDVADPYPTMAAQRLAAENQLAKLKARYNKRALSVLNRTQRARFREIEHQLTGAMMLAVPSVQKKIGLTATQKQAIKAIEREVADYVGKINREFAEGKIGAQERIALLRDRRLSEGSKALEVLTPKQRKAFRAMGGETIVISS